MIVRADGACARGRLNARRRLFGNFAFSSSPPLLSLPRATQTLGDALPPATASSRLLIALVGYCKDPVPNVRFNAAKAIARLAATGKFDLAAASAAVRPAISLLSNDRDRDVRFFALKAAAALAGPAAR